MALVQTRDWDLMNARNVLCHVIAASTGIAIAVFAGLLLDRKAVVELDAQASLITPSPSRMGETIYITWSATARRNCAGAVIPRVIDSTGRIFEYARAPTVYQDIMYPGERSFTKSLILPHAMAPGPARYQAVVIRWCNRVQELFWPMIDEPFPIFFEVAK